MNDKKENLNAENLENNATEEVIENDDSVSEISETESLNQTIAELNDKYLRSVAEIENTRRRAQLDMESVARNRAMSVAEKFLPLIDAINAAGEHNPKDEGIKTLDKAAIGVLAGLGITKIETVGQPLNPAFHNAISVVEKTDESMQPDTIVSEMQTGYMFGDTTLRPAMVTVCK